MAVKKNPLNRQPLAIDPALQAYMSQEPEAAPGSEDPVYGRLARKRARLHSMSPGQRRKAERDEQRVKVTFDWPPELKDKVQQVAQWSGVPVSQLAALLVKVGLKAIDEGRIKVDDYRRPSRVPRFEWFIDLEKWDQLNDRWKSWNS